MLLISFFDYIIAQYSVASKLLIHRPNLWEECLPEIHPKNALLAIKHVRAASNLIDILQMIGENQSAFVVDTDSCVEVVG